MKTPIFENAQKNVKKKRLRQGGDFFNFGKKITQKTPKKNAQKNASKIKKKRPKNAMKKTPIFEIRQKKRPSPKKRFFFEDVNLKKETIQKTPKKNGRTKKRPKQR